MVLKRGGRKQYKKRRAARRGRKVSGMRRKYADAHSFKLQSIDTRLYNVNNGSAVVPTTAGGTYIGSFATQPNGTVWYGGSFNFLAQNALQWNQLNTLFDRVLVSGIKVKVIPQFNVNTGGTGTGVANIPRMRMVYDFDDNSVPAVGDIWSRRGVDRRLDKPFSVYLKPKLLVNLFTAGAGGIATAPKTTQYLNCGSAGSIPLLGLKYAIKDWPVQATTVAGGPMITFEITYYMTFREQLQINKALNEEPAQLPTVVDEDGVACENKEE